MASMKDIEVPEKLIRKLSDLLKSTDLQEIEMSSGELSLRVKAKDSSYAMQVPTMPMVSPTPAGSSPSKAEATESDLHIIRSPFVGTFYRSPSPEAKSYVEEGEMVGKGQVLCIVEAMKIMNEIESEIVGKVEKIFVENGHPVDFNAPLFGIRKS